MPFVFCSVVFSGVVLGVTANCAAAPNCQARNRRECVEPQSTCGACVDGFSSDRPLGNTPCEGDGSRDGEGDGPIPIINLGLFLEGSPEERELERVKVSRAVLGPGFMFFDNHSVPLKLIDEAHSAAKDYFQKPLEEKMKFAWTDPEENSGYVKMGGEILDEDTGEGDPKEAYDMSKNHLDASPVWNDTVMPKYWEAMDKLKQEVLQCYAAAMEMPQDFFYESHDEEFNTLRLLHYPPVKEGQEMEYRAGPHSDYGSITLLIQDSVGGLQVFDRKLGKWKDVINPPQPGTVLCNTGDLLMQWSNDHLSSTMHRVVGPQFSTEHAARAKKSRYSLIYFVCPDADFVVENLMRDETPKYKPVKSLDYQVQRLSATFFGEDEVVENYSANKIQQDSVDLTPHLNVNVNKIQQKTEL